MYELNLAFVTPPFNSLLVRPLKILTVPSGEVRPLFVNQRKSVPEPLLSLVEILSLRKVPEGCSGGPDALARMCQTLVLPPPVQQWSSRFNTPVLLVAIVTGVPPVDAFSVINSALALEDQSNAPTASPTAVIPNLVIFSSK
jgi:hypothetical protein